MTNVGKRFLQIAGFGAFVGPIMIVVADSLHIFAGQDFVWTILLWLAFVLFIPGIMGLTYLAARGGSMLAVVGGVLAYFGAMAGASMQVLFRVHAVLAEMGDAATVERLKATFKLVASTQMIGLPFPLGLILLAIAYARSGSGSVIRPILLMLGAIFFPIGRIFGAQWAVLASGILFMVVFMPVGRQLFALAEDGSEAVNPVT
jgi:hypothetical protein